MGLNAEEIKVWSLTEDHRAFKPRRDVCECMGKHATEGCMGLNNEEIKVWPFDRGSPGIQATEGCGVCVCMKHLCEAGKPEG
jgi:hypothetical protein